MASGYWNFNISAVNQTNLRTTGTTFTSVGNATDGGFTMPRMVHGGGNRVFGLNGSTVYEIDATTNSVVNTFTVPAGSAVDFTYNPTDDRLYFAHVSASTPGNSRVTVVNPSTGAQTASYSYGTNINYPQAYGVGIDYNPATGTVWTIYSITTNGSGFTGYIRPVTSSGFGTAVTIASGSSNPGTGLADSFYCGGINDPRIYFKRVTSARRFYVYNIATSTMEVSNNTGLGNGVSEFISLGNATTGYMYAYTGNILYRRDINGGSVSSLSITSSVKASPVYDYSDGNIITVNGRLVYKTNVSSFTFNTSYGTLASSGTAEVASAVTFLRAV